MKLLFHSTILVTFYAWGANSISYESLEFNTLNNEQVTVENICQHFDKAPKELSDQVKKWIEEHTGAYSIICAPKGYLTDVGYLDLLAKRFFKDYPKAKNEGSMNHVFALKDSNFIIKIPSIISRFLYTASELGLDFSFGLALRTVVRNDEIATVHYVDLTDYKQKMSQYLLACFDQNFLAKKPEKSHIRTLAQMITCAMPSIMMRSHVHSRFLETYKNKKIECPDTFKEAIEQCLNEAFMFANEVGYKKADITKKKFGETYGTASRMYHYRRFVEAIEKYNLDRIEKPPISYVVQINDTDPNSCNDDDLIFVQKKLDDHKQLRTVSRSQLDIVLDKETIKQLLIAAKYAGIWDFSSSNIFVHKETKKITFVDFEPYRNITKKELFGVDKEKMKMNFCIFLCYALNRLPKDSKQQKWIQNFIEKDKDITLEEVKDADDRNLWQGYKKNALGHFLHYEHPNSNTQKAAYYREIILRKFLTNKEKLHITRIWMSIKNRLRQIFNI